MVGQNDDVSDIHFGGNYAVLTLCIWFYSSYNNLNNWIGILTFYGKSVVLYLWSFLHCKSRWFGWFGYENHWSKSPEFQKEHGIVIH